MSKKRISHLRGERGLAFADLIRGIPSEQILCVSGGAVHRRHQQVLSCRHDAQRIR